MDITLVVYVSSRTEYTAPLLAEVFGQSDELDIEMIMVDGGSMRVSFDKVYAHCKEHSIDLSVVRQDPMNRCAPGFNVAAKQARGRTLVFLNPEMHIPSDFLSIADFLGRHGKTVLPRAWINVAANNTECWGLWSPPDGVSIIVPRDHFHRITLDDIEWSSTPWPKADAYILASKIASERYESVGLATLGGYEYRRWMSSIAASGYMSSIEHSLVDVDNWVVNHDDIRRYTVLGIPFKRVTDRVPKYESMDSMEKIVRSIVEVSQNKHGNLGEPKLVSREVQRDLDEELDRMFEAGTLVVRPEFIVEPVDGKENYLVRVRSTGNVFLPHEMSR